MEGDICFDGGVTQHVPVIIALLSEGREESSSLGFSGASSEN